MALNHVGQRLAFDGALCTIRYIGSVSGTQRDWLGVEWDDTARGKHDGEHQGTRYFTCRSKSKTAASFIRPSRKPDPSQSFLEALHLKYATERTERRDALAADLQKEIEISGKTVYEVGFDKIRMQMRQLHELKIVLVDGMRVDRAVADDRRILDICPKIIDLDVSRNLFEGCSEIIKICKDLKGLKSLVLNGNRIEVAQQELESAKAKEAFSGIQSLNLDEMLLSWEEACLLSSQFASLTTLGASMNELTSLPPLPSLSTSLSRIISLTLEWNSFTSLSDISSLATLHSLERLHLKGNQISSIANSNNAVVKFGSKLSHVDLSYNAVTSWAFVDDLQDVFPGLTSLRFSHNPVYAAVPALGSGAVSADEPYMITLARIAKLETLNFSTIPHTERTNAEMFYLSRIGKELATVPRGQESSVTGKHRRYAELCELYGEPTIVRADEHINPNFLEARLIKFTFKYQESEEQDSITKTKEIPKGCDIYQVKAIAGKLFGLRPMGIKAIWETGEWDPVAGYEDEEDSDDDEDHPVTNGIAEPKAGKFIRREIELEDGTRQIGNTIDGKEAIVRIESR